MIRIGRWLIAIWVALAAWLSDQWLWTLPTLAGVLGCVRLTQLQRHLRRRGTRLEPDEPLTLLLMLLALASFVYLYVVYLVFQLGSWFHPDDEPGRPGWGLLVGCIGLGVLAAFLVRMVRALRSPRWALTLWQWLLDE